MNRFASTRSEKRDVHPDAPLPQWSVGSIDEDGMRYGLTTHALIANTIAIAPTIVTIQSMIPRQGCGTPSRTSGFSPSLGGGGGGCCGGGGSSLYGHALPSGAGCGVSSVGGGLGSRAACSSARRASGSKRSLTEPSARGS